MAARKAEDTWTVNSNSGGKQQQGEWLRRQLQFYLQRIHELQLEIRQYNLNRLEAQRNDLNSCVRMLGEEPKVFVKLRQDKLKIYFRSMNLMLGFDLKKMAEKMKGASGAELRAVCTEAGMFALRERRVRVTQEDFEKAVAKVMKKDTEEKEHVIAEAQEMSTTKP